MGVQRHLEKAISILGMWDSASIASGGSFGVYIRYLLGRANGKDLKCSKLR